MAMKVLLADDHEIMREGLCALLRKDDTIEIVGQAADGRTAVEMAKQLQPDMVIMDISMPNLNGIDATRQMIAEIPGLMVMALSTHSDRNMVAKMLKAGASGYMLKESAFTELMTGINAMKAGHTYLCPRVSEIVLSDYVSLLSDPKRSSDDILTPREREVLQLVAEGYTTKEIALKLEVSAKTIDSHREHIKDKLGIHTIAELTKYALRDGLTAL